MILVWGTMLACMYRAVCIHCSLTAGVLFISPACIVSVRLIVVIL